MNAMNMSCVASVALRNVTPKGVTPASKIKPREQVEMTLRNALISGFGVPTLHAPEAARIVYDRYQAMFGQPANVEYVTTLLRSDKGREQLEAVLVDVRKRVPLTVKPAVEGNVVTLRPAKAVRTLDPAVQQSLTQLVRDARKAHLDSGRTPRERDDSFLDAAIKTIIDTCKQAKINWFKMPYLNLYPAAGVFIGRLMQGQKEQVLPKFFFRWTEQSEGGIADEEVPKHVNKTMPHVGLEEFTVKPTINPAEAARKRLAAEVRNAQNRADRIAVQPAKGRSGQNDGKKSSKKGQGKKN